MNDAAFRNRLRKNFAHWSKWAKRQGLGAYRIYDGDIPDYPFSIDWYQGRIHLLHYPRSRAVERGTAAIQRQRIVPVVHEVLAIPEERVFTKVHAPKVWGAEQYKKMGEAGEFFAVAEQGLQFWINLGDYLDSGLFLDHRLTRARVRKEAQGKRFLNLFGYTGSFTVYAAAGGADHTTTVDTSRAYLDWATRNLSLNYLDGPGHEMVCTDAVQWLLHHANGKVRYDLIVLDPPSFSASKKMKRRFEIQRDHPQLIEQAVSLLNPGGSLYFSTNYQQFQLRWSPMAGTETEELTPGSIPDDFRNKRIHRCWQIRKNVVKV